MSDKMPAPNLQGDYRGSCVVCLRGTDTGLAFVGEAEWLWAGLRTLGVSDDKQVEAMILGFFHDELGAEPGMILDGRHTMPGPRLR